ncbi:restriction endonuclease [Janibacter indicus]|uniref:Restriction endonuclease n=1 Tax=Janibacter indicus TaxID=857417 RepID=A0A7L9J3J4_9MICO|nr:restriction endonuclease [Janibacter indicus]QOK24191.1 restriction endonuclease [Janibacter indicus]
MSRAWVVRAGRDGEQEQVNLASGTATIGWNVGDLTGVSAREEVRAIIDVAYPDDSPGRRANFTGQVWAFRSAIEPGDIVLMPSKLRPGYIYLGRCIGPYRYVAGEPDLSRRHQLPVEWKKEPVSKSAIKDDLLYSLNGIMTVFNPSRNNAAERVRALFETGTDPGSAAAHATAPEPAAAEALTADVTDPDPTPTIEAIRDRIRTHLVEHFSGHKFTALVADILETLGFRCEVSPSGPDGGVDILAGRGPLGLDSPTLIVEVKSEPGPIDVKVVRGLHSAMTQYRADQGLLVAWGGVTGPAAREFKRDRTSFRIWDSEELLNRLFETYDNLPAETRARIPLKQAWVLDEGSL